MKIRTLYLLISLLLVSITATAQEEVKKNSFGVYLEAQLYLLYSGISLSGGFLMNKKHGVGIEYQDFLGYSSEARGMSVKGIGLNYRFTYVDGLYLKVSSGMITEAEAWLDDADNGPYLVWNRGTGIYFAGNVGYHFRSGLLLGFGLSTTNNVNFERFEYDDILEEHVFVRDEDKNKKTLLIVLGYSFPGRWGGKNKLGSRNRSRKNKRNKE